MGKKFKNLMAKFTPLHFESQDYLNLLAVCAHNAYNTSLFLLGSHPDLQALGVTLVIYIVPVGDNHSQV